MNTRKIQSLKANHHSKNGATFAVDMDIALLNVFKNDKIIRTNNRNIGNQINHFINTKKRPKITKQKQ